MKKHKNKNGKADGWNHEILRINICIVVDSLRKHRNVFVLDMDMSTPVEMNQEKISAFTQKLASMEKEEGCDLDYMITDEGNAKYKMGLVFGGNKPDNVSKHIEKTKEALQYVIGSESMANTRIDKSTEGVLVKNEDIWNERNGDYDEAIRQLNLLAKDDKADGKKGKEFYCSRTKID